MNKKKLIISTDKALCELWNTNTPEHAKEIIKLMKEWLKLDKIEKDELQTKIL